MWWTVPFGPWKLIGVVWVGGWVYTWLERAQASIVWRKLKESGFTPGVRSIRLSSVVR